jgi:hypothetical protein
MNFNKEDPIAIRRWRKEARRYWHDADADARGLLAEIGAAR